MDGRGVRVGMGGGGHRKLEGTRLKYLSDTAPTRRLFMQHFCHIPFGAKTLTRKQSFCEELAFYIYVSFFRVGLRVTCVIDGERYTHRSVFIDT